MSWRQPVALVSASWSKLERGKPTVQMGKVLDVLAALGCELQIRKPDGTIVDDQSPRRRAAETG